MMERFQEDLASQPGAAVETGAPASFRIETLLRRCGIDDTTAISIRERMSDIHVRELVKKFNRYARENPAVVLGALCALAVGGTVVAGRVIRKGATRRNRIAKTRRTAKASTKRASSKRTLIEPHRRRRSKSTAKSGQRDKGDR
jgi:hypothetical protein